MSDADPPSGAVLFAEPGAHMRAVAYGPALCLLVAIVELATGSRVHVLMLIVFAVLIAGIVYAQVTAAQRYLSVELTPQTLRQGTEKVPLSDIAQVFPPADEESWEPQPWESAPALGDLVAVPRRRTGIGLELENGKVVQAWAKDHGRLRAELTAALAHGRDDAL
ncbi:hypothetical protein FOS14_12390 [Skermania sp. ID1734]|uniref:hypothetical protein n=1 Tax=Skermania sp. ID1734 TaxID=2597516 RepID=UPI00117EACA5|nr:hypothetical protein [Skermania sp. ID1734]TSD99560.1 hypothetical protein FOS14_12390 [Skermania sp. ID1734]